MANKIQLSQEVIDQIIDYYCNKQYGQQKTANLVGVSIRIVRRILLENNIKLRNFSEAAKISNVIRRQYSVNDSFFSSQSSQMAYYLGFIAADGTVAKDSNQIKIGLSSVDRSFLVQMKKDLQIENEIFDYQTTNGFMVSELHFTSQQIKKDLALYGVVPRKTYSFVFPEKLDRRYYIDFIRGYFDGDGSVSTVGKSAIRFQICAYRKEILESIVRFFYEEYHIAMVSVLSQTRNGNKLYYFQYSTNATKQIFSILYTPSCTKLQRKYDKYLSLI